MSFGFMGKILRVDLANGTISEEELREDVMRTYIGGVGLATRYLYDEVPKGADPFGPENLLIFMTGPLAGTASASASRYSAVAKSPLTGIWGHANSGGSFGPALKRSGYDGIIFQGIFPKPVYLSIEEGTPELRDAAQLWGKAVPQTEDLIQQSSDKQFTIASIGPAGENLVRFASIMNNTHRAAGRCGLGYVTANRGGDHITGYIEGPTFIDTPFLLVEDSKIEDVFVANPKEAKVLVDMENALTMFDAIGGCKFMGILLKAEDFIDLITNATGWEMSIDEFRKSGERIYNLIRAYCVREGVSREADTLLSRLMEEPLPEGPAEGMVIDRDTLEMMKDAYYEFRGWDKETGITTREKLRELGLEDLINDLWARI